MHAAVSYDDRFFEQVHYRMALYGISVCSCCDRDNENRIPVDYRFSPCPLQKCLKSLFEIFSIGRGNCLICVQEFFVVCYSVSALLFNKDKNLPKGHSAFRKVDSLLCVNS